MIIVSQAQPDPSQLIQTWGLNNTEKEILEKMAGSEQIYSYDSFQPLRFELKLRDELVKAALALHRSGASFAVFSKSRCNEEYWSRTENGGFQLRPGVPPSTGIQDIFNNGREYGFECTTAVMIMCYKAILDALDADTFNRLFPNLFLWDGYYDEDLALTKRLHADLLPGDIRYIKNPDFDPDHPEWQGENTIYLGKGAYFGHGIGVARADDMIRILNRKRRPGATESAYLMDEAIFPNFKHLAQYYTTPVPEPSSTGRTAQNVVVVARVGSRTYLTT